eukprot:GFKZ01014185.1.p1 GENE.GFKZ01014185.1~~GFKZ01014185.1.p1  ORF type:complete len:102 (-),score=7.06 GFKZ01014185.1:189-494(-)
MSCKHAFGSLARLHATETSLLPTSSSSTNYISAQRGLIFTATVHLISSLRNETLPALLPGIKQKRTASGLETKIKETAASELGCGRDWIIFVGSRRIPSTL